MTRSRSYSASTSSQVVRFGENQTASVDSALSLVVNQHAVLSDRQTELRFPDQASPGNSQRSMVHIDFVFGNVRVDQAQHCQRDDDLKNTLKTSKAFIKAIIFRAFPLFHSHIDLSSDNRRALIDASLVTFWNFNTL